MIDHNETVLTKTVAMPADTNPNGDIFGGWLLSQMDVAGSILAKKIALEVGFQGEVKWDISKPDGTPKKLLDISRIQSLGWKPIISLDEGIYKTVKLFEKMHENNLKIEKK